MRWMKSVLNSRRHVDELAKAKKITRKRRSTFAANMGLVPSPH